MRGVTGDCARSLIKGDQVEVEGRTPAVTRTTRRKIPTRRKSRRKNNLKEEQEKKKTERKEMNRGKGGEGEGEDDTSSVRTSLL